MLIRVTLHGMEGGPPVELVDAKPALWVGHVVLATHDLTTAFAFYRDLGLRAVHEARATDAIAELELRGGTHLVLVLDAGARIDGRAAPFDLMADDLDALREAMDRRGIEVSAIERGPHASFTFRDADGWTVTVNDSHVVGRV
ncbi:MAG TPA: VOC family protein [Acidimicrobiia bacterium]|nr:VOC family protein [Acidimicrobiia bacterium]